MSEKNSGIQHFQMLRIARSRMNELKVLGLMNPPNASSSEDTSIIMYVAHRTRLIFYPTFLSRKKWEELFRKKRI